MKAVLFYPWAPFTHTTRGLSWPHRVKFWLQHKQGDLWARKWWDCYVGEFFHIRRYQRFKVWQVNPGH